MKQFLSVIILLVTMNSFASEPLCEALSTEEFLGELMTISQEHSAMPAAQISKDYLLGIEFIKNTFGENSKQYESAMVFVSDKADMTVEDYQTVEGLRIQIIPILGVDSIYKEHKETLMRKCREVLLAAMILT